MKLVFKITTILYIFVLSAISQEINNKQFVKAFVDNKEPFVNQQITYTFRFYHQNVLIEEPEYSLPSFNGFLTRKLKTEDTKFEVLDGITYRVEEFKTLLFPVSAGKREIESASLYIPAFNEEFDQPKTLTTKSIKLNIKPLPEEGKPSNFSGAVGKYQIKAQVNKTTVIVGQPVTLEIVLSGTGNIENLNKPEIPEIKYFKRFKPTETISIFSKSPKLKGKVRWEYVLVAEKSGDYTVSSIRYNYFNPQTKAYKLIQTPPISIVVKPGANQITARTQNIQQTKTSAEQSTRFYQRLYFWIIVIMVFLSVVGVIILRKYTNQQKVSSNYIERDAAQVAEERLNRIEKSIGSEDSVKLFTDLAQTVRRYLSDKLDIPQVELKLESLKSLMVKAGYPEEAGKKFAKILERSNHARFAPVSVSSEEVKIAVRTVRTAIMFLENID